MQFASVIVTFNRKELLVESIEALLNQSEKPDRIIIIDNHSNDGTKELLTEKGFLNDSSIEYHYLPKNIGGAGGFAKGLALALESGVDWVTVSDDDAIYSKDYFSKIKEAIKKYPGIGVLTGTVKLTDGRIQDTHRRRVTDWNRIVESTVPVEEYKHDFNLDLFTFVGSTISTNLIRQIGLPKSEFFIWWDDIEYSLRARRVSKIINISNAVVTHKTAIPSNDFFVKYKRDWREYYGWRNRIVTQRLHAKSKFLVNIYLPLWFIKRYVLLVKPFYKNNRKHLAVLYYRAFRDAYCYHMGLNKHYLPGSK